MAANRSHSHPKCKGQRLGFLAGLLLGLAAALAAPLRAAETRTLVFFGDSLTAGYGLDPDEAYPALIQRKIDAAGLRWRVVNAGLSGETTAGGLRRLDWILRQRVDLFVIELGGNDGLRGIDPEATRANLQALIERIRARYPDVIVVLAGMQLPTNLGPEHTRRFAAMYPELAEKNHAVLIPFLLDGVGGVPSLNLPDGIHPTAEGHQIVAETVWRVLRPLL
ncbi:MAG: arylesterase [Opitutaceae bacterium]|nr:arylesterase [Opitutaceae bacterium]